MTMAKEDMARKIKELRQQQGLTLEQVANVVGVGKSTVRKWETGMIANMRRDKIAALAKALGTTPAYLMGWEEEKTRFTHSMEVHSVATSILEQINSPDQMVLTEGEKMLIELFRQIPEDAQKMYVEVLRASLKNQP
jgi:transcriptional regulator with XRE-family HTH domain